MKRVRPSVSLHLYRFAEDAWTGGLRAWCEMASKAALEGAHCWLAAASRGQIRWIKKRALGEGMTLFGIRFLEPRSLRRELCALLGLEAVELGGEALEFVLRTAAAGDEEIARNAGACLRAMDDLAAAGWSESELDVEPATARLLFKTMRESRGWTPELDQRLLNKANNVPLLSCVAGWDAAHFGELGLLQGLAQAATRCDLFLPMPRPAAETLQQSWVDAVESRLDVEKNICAASGFASPHEELASRLEGADLDGRPSAAPRLLVGRDWRDQIRLVRDDVLAWLAAAPKGARVALIVPGRGPSSLKIVRELAQAGVALLDETGEKVEPAAGVVMAAKIVRYHLLGGDLEPLVELTALRNEAGGGNWQWLDAESVHRVFNKAYANIQSRSARLLASELGKSGDPAARRVAELVAHLGAWTGEKKWSDWCRKWETSLASEGFEHELPQPLRDDLQRLLGSRKIQANAFLEFLDAIFSARNSQRPADAAEPHARVVVTTLANALHQTWERIVFLDSCEGVWPRAAEENTFLDDAARAALNARGGPRGHLLTTGDHAALAEAHFLDVLEHCTGELVFAAYSRGAAEDGSRTAYPNEWVIRSLVECLGSGAAAAMEHWECATEICPEEPAALPEQERRHLQVVHASRSDPAMPLDQYSFNFHDSPLAARAWSAARLDEALSCPATFALREIFGAEALRENAWTRGEGMVVGSLTHRWLARALGGSDEFKPLDIRDYSSELDAEINATRGRLRDCYAEENLPLPIWWETCLRKAAWVAGRCLAPIARLEGAWFYAMEKSARQEVATASGALRLKGRFDLVLSDRPSLKGARLRVIDFKTGKSEPPSFATLAKGEGHQFAAYFLMARDVGAASVAVGVIRPDFAKLDSFTDADEMGLREVMEPLAKLQQQLNFGRRGALVAAWGKCETLPIATLAIEPEVLAQKAGLFLLAS